MSSSWVWFWLLAQFKMVNSTLNHGKSAPQMFFTAWPLHHSTFQPNASFENITLQIILGDLPKPCINLIDWLDLCCNYLHSITLNYIALLFNYFTSHIALFIFSLTILGAFFWDALWWLRWTNLFPMFNQNKQLHFLRLSH